MKSPAIKHKRRQTDEYTPSVLSCQCPCGCHDLRLCRFAADNKIVIAHRGASGYLPEHTLPAKAMAYAQGADYLEQDLVITKDDELIVLHDHYLDRVTDVAKRFPDRARKDGRYYAIDFTLAEIKSLKFTEGFEIENGKAVQKYPAVFRWENQISVFIPFRKNLSSFRV